MMEQRKALTIPFTLKKDNLMENPLRIPMPCLSSECGKLERQVPWTAFTGCKVRQNSQHKNGSMMLDCSRAAMISLEMTRRKPLLLLTDVLKTEPGRACIERMRNERTRSGRERGAARQKPPVKSCSETKSRSSGRRNSTPRRTQTPRRQSPKRSSLRRRIEPASDEVNNDTEEVKSNEASKDEDKFSEVVDCGLSVSWEPSKDAASCDEFTSADIRDNKTEPEKDIQHNLRRKRKDSGSQCNGTSSPKRQRQSVLHLTVGDVADEEVAPAAHDSNTIEDAELENLDSNILQFTVGGDEHTQVLLPVNTPALNAANAVKSPTQGSASSQENATAAKLSEPIVLSSDDEESESVSRRFIQAVFRRPPRGNTVIQGLTTQRPVARRSQISNRPGSRMLPAVRGMPRSVLANSRHDDDYSTIEVAFSTLHCGGYHGKSNGDIMIEKQKIVVPLQDASEEMEVLLSFNRQDLMRYSVWEQHEMQEEELIFRDDEDPYPAAVLLFFVSQTAAASVQRDLCRLGIKRNGATKAGKASPFILLTLTCPLEGVKGALLRSVLDIECLNSMAKEQISRTPAVDRCYSLDEFLSPILSLEESIDLMCRIGLDSYLLTMLGVKSANLVVNVDQGSSRSGSQKSPAAPSEAQVKPPEKSQAAKVGIVPILEQETSPAPKPETSPAREPEISAVIELDASPALEPDASPAHEPDASLELEPDVSPALEPDNSLALELVTSTALKQDTSPALEPDVCLAQEPDASLELEPDASPAQELDASPAQELDASPAQELDASPELEPDTSPALEPDDATALPSDASLELEPDVFQALEPDTSPALALNASLAPGLDASPTQEPDVCLALEPNVSPSQELDASPALELHGSLEVELDSSLPLEPKASPSVETETFPPIEPEVSPAVEPEASWTLESEALLTGEAEASLAMELEASLAVEPETSSIVEPETSSPVEREASPTVEPEASPTMELKISPVLEMKMTQEEGTKLTPNEELEEAQHSSCETEEEEPAPVYTLSHRRNKGSYSVSLCKPDSKWTKYKHLGLPRRLIQFPPPPQKGGITVTMEDLQCLDNGQFLNDVIIDFYLKYLIQNASASVAERSHIFSSFFYKQLTRRDNASEGSSSEFCQRQRRHQRVKTWTRHVDIFKKDFLFVPVNQEAHWYLVVICFPGLDEPKFEAGPKSQDEEEESHSQEEAQEWENSNDATDLPPSLSSSSTVNTPAEKAPEDSTKDFIHCPVNCTELTCQAKTVCKRPCILIMDSLKLSLHERVFKLLRDYLQSEWEVRRGSSREFGPDQMRSSHCKVPLQDNSSDCGLYLLQYVESFLKDPVVHFELPLCLERWFPRQQVRRKRDDIRNLILYLYRLQNVDFKHMKLPSF